LFSLTSTQPLKGAIVSETTVASEAARPGFSDNGIAALAYITFVPAMFFLILSRYKHRSYVRFHAWQSILLDLFAFTASLVLTLLAEPALHSGAYFLLGAARVSWGLWFGLWVATSICALSGKRLRIPVIGRMAERLAK
jgi:uncharacterized membrane protein